MRTGLGLYRKYRMLYAYLNLLRFSLRKNLIGFDVANIFIQRVDKISLQLILKKYGAKIGNHCDIETGLIFHNCKDYSNLSIGNNCHIGKNCFFDLRDRITIGNNVVISMQCCFITHIDMSKSPLKQLFPAKQLYIHIHDNCYIGAGVRILMGTTLNKNAFIAANSLVIKDVDENRLVSGIPAKYSDKKIAVE